MGRGDKRTKKGKIFRGSYGKARPKPSNVKVNNETKSEEGSSETEE